MEKRKTVKTRKAGDDAGTFVEGGTQPGSGAYREEQPGSRRDTAVIVFHGMGQQVPFQTLGDVADKVRRRKPWVDAQPRTVAENVPCRAPGASADATLSRIRMALAGPGEKARNIDFYESYWAPVTAGKVAFFDVLVFLLQAGCDGIRFTLPRAFSRFFWGSRKSFPLPFAENLAMLSASLALVACFAGLILGLGFAIQSASWREYVAALSFLFRGLHLAALPILLALLFSRHRLGLPAQAGLAALVLFGLASFFLAIPPDLLSGKGWKPFSGDFAPWTWPFLVLLAILVLDGILMGAALLKQPRPDGQGTAPDYFARVVWLQSGLMGLLLVAGVLTACILAAQGFQARDLALGGDVLLWIYGLLGVAVLALLRKFLIEYVGDVAAYLSSHKASKFSEIRRSIQADGFKVAGHVFASDYTEVIFVGHSLGSVIAYDTLNGIINHDLIHNQGAWNAAERTRLLLTFGSPLDKIAFIFRAQVKDNLCRELLASAKQPLLEENHAYRPMAWVNVWSPCDIISGPLDYFDRGTLTRVPGTGAAEHEFTYLDPGPHAPVAVQVAVPGPRPEPRKRPVVSFVDPGADIPFKAHTQFWDNDLIYRILSEALQDPGDGSGFRKFIRID